MKKIIKWLADEIVIRRWFLLLISVTLVISGFVGLIQS